MLALPKTLRYEYDPDWFDTIFILVVVACPFKVRVPATVVVAEVPVAKTKALLGVMELKL